MTVRKTCPSLLIKKCGIRKHSKILLVLSLIVLVAGMYMTMGTARGAEVTNFKDTLSTSVPDAEANHTLSFVLGSAIAEGNTLIITFGSGFNNATNGAVDYTDIDLMEDAAEATLGADCTGTDMYSAVISGDIVLTFTACVGDGGAMDVGDTVTVEIGTNALNEETGNAQFENGSAGTEDVDITGSSNNTGSAKVIFIAGVTVSATVADTLSATVGLVNSSTCDTALASSGTFVTTTATAVPFGSITANQFNDGCQSLTISTNASDGYTATVQETDQLTHTDTTTQIVGANDDGNCDDATACSDTTENEWSGTTVTSAGFGYCMTDACSACSGNGAATADAGWGTTGCEDTPAKYKTIADAGNSEAAQIIMQSATAVSGDISYAGFRLLVDTAQKGGVYSNTIVYIVTPQYD